MFVHVPYIELIDTYIPPNIRYINPISKQFTPNRRFTADELPTWVEQSQDLMLSPTVSFLIVTYSHFLVFQSSFKLHFALPTFIPRHLRFACWVSVCN